MAGASTSKRIVRRCWIRGHTPASVVAVALLTALLALAGCEGVTSTHTTPALSPTLGAHEVTTTPAAPVKGGQIAVVAITGSVQFAYSPGNLTIPVGGSVSWQNSSSQPHTVTMDPGAPVAIPSETLQPSFVYTYTFTKAGVYHYHCAYHPYMKGTITVTP